MMNNYSPPLVLASLVISILAGWAALEISCRIYAQRTQGRKTLWLSSGAFVMGLGIWAMHYVGMLALHTGVVILYYVPTVLLSFFAAVASSAVALYLVSQPTMSGRRVIAGGLFMGGGIASMHYIGMAAMRFPCTITYSGPLVALSILLAVGISMVALQICFFTKRDEGFWSPKKLGSALLMGCAIPIMHYVGMAAVHMEPIAGAAVIPGLSLLSLSMSPSGITAVIGSVICCICFALLLASFNRDALAAQVQLERVESEHTLLSTHQQRLIKAYRRNGVGAWEWDPVTDSFSVDRNVASIYDVDFQEDQSVSRARFLELVHPDDLPLIRERWTTALTSGNHYENEYRILHRDGQVRRCRSIATVTRHSDNSVASVLGMSWDITAEHQKQQDHAEQARRFHLTLEAIGDAVLSVGADQTILYANPVACELTGWPKDECLGRSFTDVFVAQDEVTGIPRTNPILRCIELGGKMISEDAMLLSRNGVRYNIQKHINLVDQHGSAVVTFRDITAATQLKRELEIAANHDSLTGLPNRVAFQRLLQHVWNTERNGIRLHCLALLDLDRFKLINDTAGHPAGDALLQQVVHLLRPALRPGDCLARMGGDEFLLLLRDTTPEQAKAFCNTLLQTVEDLHFVWQKRNYSVTASLGMVFFDQDSPSIEALTSQADVALFTSKRNGRNRVAIYEDSVGDAAGTLQQMEVISEIRLALDQHRFELHAQPIVSLHHTTAEPYFELLVRMRDRSGALIPPAQFIPAAECYGMMLLIDRWVIQKALALYAESLQAHRSMRFAINLSADSLSDPTLWNFVYQQFQVTGVPPTSITFEVTESGLIHNLGTARTFLALARKAGCRIALDDFGTGMSSLSYLKQFPLDVIKIDGSFIRKIVNTPLDRSIVQAISQIAHSMGAETVAECAEDMETVHLISALGVDYVQGWATGKPEPLQPLLEQFAEGRQLASSRPASTRDTLSGVLPYLPEPQAV